MLEKIKSAYMIGVGGISMSAIARFLKARGIEVYGSDLVYNDEVKGLVRDKIIEFRPFSAPSFVKKCDIIIYTSAVSNKNTDILYAKMLGKPLYSRAEILGELSKGKATISVAGSHGKTTTTGLISSMFLKGKIKPNIHIGGVLNNINSNVLVSDNDIFITEACEYKDSFLTLDSKISVILNIKPDHLDYFKTLENEFESFQQFADNTAKNGYVIVNNDDKLCRKLQINQNKLTFALKNDADLQAKDVKKDKNGQFVINVCFKGENLGKIKIPCYGEHNILNVLACCGVGIAFNLPFKQIKRGVESYKGTKRRFEIICERKKHMIVHDYAHHPDEIRATIKLCRQLRHGKLIVIFQPHTFSRTLALYDDFLKCFEGADEVWLLPIYPAREKPIKGISSYRLAQDLKKSKKNVKYFNNFDKCYDNIKQNKEKNVIFAILGAGDIEKLAYKFKK